MDMGKHSTERTVVRSFTFVTIGLVSFAAYGFSCAGNLNRIDFGTHRNILITFTK